MATKSDALIVQAAFALSQGAAGSRISEKACSWFHERYYRWIETKSTTGETPAEVWKSRKGGFLERFKEIGRLAREASGGKEIAESHLRQAARIVESKPGCPYCPS
jgi:hypothetical protein